MKKILLFLLLLCSIGVSAQDVIVKKDGSTIVCRVVEVNQTEVVYKRWSNLEGPNYVMNLSDISAINYENGEKIKTDGQTENVTTTSPIVQNKSGQQTVSDDALLKMVSKPNKNVDLQRAKRIKKVGYIAGPVLIAGGLLMTITGSDTGHDQKTLTSWDTYLESPGLLAGGIILLSGGIATTTGCLIRAHNIKKRASRLSVQSVPLFQQEFHLKNGTTLSPSIDVLKDNARRNPTLGLGLGLTYNF